MSFYRRLSITVVVVLVVVSSAVEERSAFCDATPSEAVRPRQVVMLLAESGSMDAAEVTEALSSQLSDLPVSFRTETLEGKNGTDAEAMAEGADERIEGGADMVIWLDGSTPGQVFFLTAGGEEHELFKRRFEIDESEAAALEKLAQICRATVQVLIDLEHREVSRAPEPPRNASPKAPPPSPPTASAVEAAPSGPRVEIRTAAPPKKRAPVFEMSAAYAYSGFSHDNPALNALSVGLSARLGEHWRIILSFDPVMQRAEERVAGCFFLEYGQYPIAIGTENVWTIKQGPFSLGPTAALRVSVDVLEYQWTGECDLGLYRKTEPRRTRGMSLHQLVGLVARVKAHRRVHFFLELKADFFLGNPVYHTGVISGTTENPGASIRLDLRRWPVAPSMVIGARFGVI
jgi:hypothetical protein